MAVIPTDGQAPVLRRADGSAVRILVVEDESTLSELLAIALSLRPGFGGRVPGDATAQDVAPTARGDAGASGQSSPVAPGTVRSARPSPRC